MTKKNLVPILCSLVAILCGCGGGEEGGVDYLNYSSPTYGAIALNSTSGAAGIAYNYKSKSEASFNASQKCGLVNCKVVFEFGENMCAALARSSVSATFGWASDTSRSDAKSKAISQCFLYGGIGCTVILDACNS
jgi:hypothetical protein